MRYMDEDSPCTEFGEETTLPYRVFSLTLIAPLRYDEKESPIPFWKLKT